MHEDGPPHVSFRLLIVAALLLAIGVAVVLAGFASHVVWLRRTTAVILDSSPVLYTSTDGRMVSCPMVKYEYTSNGTHCVTERCIECNVRGVDVHQLGSLLPVYVSRWEPCHNYAVCPPRYGSLIIAGGVIICIGFGVALSWSST
jgi:hypothetical protein